MDTASVDSDELEIYYNELAEKEEEISNQIYEGLEARYGETEEEKERDLKDEVEEHSDDEYEDKINEGLYSKSVKALPESLKSPEGFQELSPEEIPIKPRALSPVRKVDIHQVELPSLDGIEKVNYDTLLHREVGESAEMFEMRVKLAEIFSNASIPRGTRFVSLDVKTVMLFSRMMANKLWLGMEYNTIQEKLLDAVIEHIPELRDL